MTKRLSIVRNDGHTWGRHSTSFDAIRMSFGHSTVIPNANLDCFFLSFLVNRRGRYASKWRSFSFGGQSIGDQGKGSSSFHEADMPPNDDDFHSRAIPPATHGRGPFRRSSSFQETKLHPNDDDFHSKAIPPATHGRGPFRRSSSFHETKLHPNDGHFHLVVIPSAIQGKGLHVRLVHKSMILQSGPFLVLEPQKYTC